mmetsp:Transcript_17611/g.21088  ORF Transcript_17611/g.21088 Transcript_17611/m.21088 type:complete len:319 (-) Transcript_17611:402-1358(-)
MALRANPIPFYFTTLMRGQKRYLSSTVAPASSNFFLISSASAFATPSLIGFGAPSTSSLASFRPRPPTTSRTTLITLIFLAPASVSTTSNSSFSSAAAASPPAAGPATATAAAALMPRSSRKSLSSFASRMVRPRSSSPIFAISAICSDFLLRVDVCLLVFVVGLTLCRCLFANRGDSARQSLTRRVDALTNLTCLTHETRNDGCNLFLAGWHFSKRFHARIIKNVISHKTTNDNELVITFSELRGALCRSNWILSKRNQGLINEHGFHRVAALSIKRFLKETVLDHLRCGTLLAQFATELGHLRNCKTGIACHDDTA